MRSLRAGLFIKDVRPIEVDFIAHRFRGGQALWVHPRHGFGDHADDPYREFAQRFSVAVRNGQCFGSYAFVDTEFIALKGERYGGCGIGSNGGGSRCGNMDGYQLKGVGPNPLVGDHTKLWHSYGGLNARDAVYETIMTEVLETVLPVGAARIYGLILTGSESAYYEGDETDPSLRRGWGAILVREICLRPGHFLRAADYKPNRREPLRISPDRIRVEKVNQALHAAFQNVEELIRRIGGFLQNCANQLAFARLARITHGGIGPANLCFDGRWIDLTNATFIGGGENVGGRPPFYEEPFAVRAIVSEFIDTFSKYNRLSLDPTPLIKYYDQKFTAYLSHYLPLLFGINPAIIGGYSQKSDFGTLLAQANLVLNSGKIMINRWPMALSPDDPVVQLQTGLFLSLYDSQGSLEELSRFRRTVPGFSLAAAIASFHALIRAAHAASTRVCPFYVHARMCAIEALRRSLYAEYFFKRRLAKHIEALLNLTPLSCRQLIDESVLLSEWIFRPPDGITSYLFRSGQVSLAFEAQSGSFLLRSRRVGGELLEREPESVLELLDRFPEEDFVVQSYDFRKPLTKLLKVLARMRSVSDANSVDQSGVAKA